MEYLNRYLRKVGDTSGAAGAPFIENALNKIKIHRYTSGEVYSNGYDAVLIFRDREGPDEGILYTYEKDGLKTGDSIVKKGSRDENDAYYLLVEEVKRVDGSAAIRVFNVLETNVLFSTQDSQEKRPAYLVSNLRRVTSTGSNSRDGFALESKGATLVAPKGYKLRLDSKLNIENLITKEESYASWLVEGIDDVSTPNINYIRLQQVMREEFDYTTPSTEDEEGNEKLDAFSSLTLPTFDGYVKTTPAANLLDRRADRVIIQVPAGPGKFLVETKNEQNEVVKHNYIIRG